MFIHGLFKVRKGCCTDGQRHVQVVGHLKGDTAVFVHQTHGKSLMQRAGENIVRQRDLSGVIPAGAFLNNRHSVFRRDPRFDQQRYHLERGQTTDQIEQIVPRLDRMTGTHIARMHDVATD